MSNEPQKVPENPFSALLDASQAFRGPKTDAEFEPMDTENTQNSVDMTNLEEKKEDVGKEAQERLDVNQFVEEVFLITLDIDKRPNRVEHLVFLEELSSSCQDQSWFEWDQLDQALFERLLIQSPAKFLTKTSTGPDSSSLMKQAVENRILFYLFDCYLRLLRKSPNFAQYPQHIASAQSLIVNNAKTCLTNPEIFNDQKTHLQWIELFKERNDYLDGEELLKFLLMVAVEFEKDGDEGSDVIKKILDAIRYKCDKEVSLFSPDLLRYMDIIGFFTRSKYLAETLLKFSTPRDPNNGKEWENTLLGALLSKSCIPLMDTGPFEFFERPSRYLQQEHDITQNNIWQAMARVHQRMYEIFLSLLKLGPDLRHRLLFWIGDCLRANSGKAKEWAEMTPFLYASDGFFVNLNAVLLKLCKPFATPQSAKLLKVDYRYPASAPKSRSQAQEMSVHLQELMKETCFISLESRPEPSNVEFNFLTECFFMAHRCFYMGFNRLQSRFFKINQNLHRLEVAYRDLSQQRGESDSVVANMKERFDSGMSMFLSIKAALLEPQTLQAALDLHVASATWLSNLGSGNSIDAFNQISFPLSAETPTYLGYIPEFILYNIADSLVFLQRFHESSIEECGLHLDHLMTFLLIFMGHRSRLKNPHLRASLAEALAALLPHHPDVQRGRSNHLIPHFHRERIFNKHVHVKFLAASVIEVFVGIEMTGSGVAFEQKFNYRHPMYVVLDYIWEIENHREALKALAISAEAHMEDPTPPLFLRFVNLLMNDAIYLLDEALSYMSQMKHNQRTRDAGEWEQLPPEQRAERENSHRHMAMLARFHNIMSNETIHELEVITRHIKSIFSHPMIVDRIASMLNYFLLHLVGPKRRDLKVKDADSFEFKPRQLVADICQIYLNLADDVSFCSAISRDGRSYSRNLFPQAEEVLVRIGRPGGMIHDFGALHEKVVSLAESQDADDEAFADAPEEFIDPILGMLMCDPVTLPSSGVVVDRATIARHLLSDQSDPFNRSPLNMELIKPNPELKQKIEDWKQSIRSSKRMDPR